MDYHQQELNDQLINAVKTNAPPARVVTIINNGASPIHGVPAAVENGTRHLLRLLITYGANIRACNTTLVAAGRPPLFTRALASPHARKMIKILSAYGLKPTVTDYTHACLHNMNVIDQLIKYGISPDTPVDSYNHTALMGLATCYSTYPISFITEHITTLIDHDAEIDMQDTQGKTALILCVQEAHPPHKYAIAHTLLTLGANPLLQDHSGKSALEYTHGVTALFQLISDSVYAWINKL
jgi:hypothetical protein